MVATVAFLAGGAATLLILTLLTKGFVAWVLVPFAAACASACGVFYAFDRFGLLPDDPSKQPTGLGLGRNR